MAADNDMTIISRRTLIASGAAAVAAASSPSSSSTTEWSPGDLLHLLPAANHDTILIKAAFRTARRSVRLRVNGTNHAGQQSDTQGRYWSFLVSGLNPDTVQMLQLADRSGPLCDRWPLKTMPHPDQPVDAPHAKARHPQQPLAVGGVDVDRREGCGREVGGGWVGWGIGCC